MPDLTDPGTRWLTATFVRGRFKLSEFVHYQRTAVRLGESIARILLTVALRGSDFAGRLRSESIRASMLRDIP